MQAQRVRENTSRTLTFLLEKLSLADQKKGVKKCLELPRRERVCSPCLRTESSSKKAPLLAAHRESCRLLQRSDQPPCLLATRQPLHRVCSVCQTATQPSRGEWIGEMLLLLWDSGPLYGGTVWLARSAKVVKLACWSLSVSRQFNMLPRHPPHVPRPASR